MDTFLSPKSLSIAAIVPRKEEGRRREGKGEKKKGEGPVLIKVLTYFPGWIPVKREKKGGGGKKGRKKKREKKAC